MRTMARLAAFALAGIFIRMAAAAEVAAIPRLLWENDKILALEIVAKPGERAALPGGHEQLIYPLKNCRVRFDSAAGKSWETDVKKGQAISSHPPQVAAYIVGDFDCDLLIFEVKAQPAPVSP